jgi:hypothetical protein
MSERLTVINVVSPSYSGSTWLNLLLGAHPQALCIGELARIKRLGKPICELHGQSCPLWSRYDPAAKENAFVQMARLSGRRVLVAKNAEVFAEDLADPSLDVRMVELIRDGRAVAASTLRKYPNLSMRKAARRWVREVHKGRALIDQYGRDRSRLVLYEDLLSHTEPRVRELCEWLGLPFEPAMLAYWAAPDMHFLGGNRGTLYNLLRLKDGQATLAPDSSVGATKANWDLGFYEKQDPTKFADERWKTELSNWQLRVFALATMGLNRRLGYPPALRRD